MDLFGNLKFFINPDKVCIDNLPFRVCTKVTFVILISASLVVTSRQYIGDPIDCIVEGIPPRVMDTFCWFWSTYTLINRLKGVAGRDVVLPGVGSESGYDIVKYHRYYQWVCFALFFQAMASYLPRYMWKHFEGGRLRALSEELKNPILDKAKKDARKLAAINYIRENLNQHTFYAYRFFFCEFLNFGIAIGQFFFTNYFLGDEFFYYGLDVLRFGTETTVDPMAKVFPKMTKCIFNKYGPSGSIQKYDGLCVLSVNNINEKIYLLLWFWFIGMVIVSGIAVIYRLLIFCIPPLRLCMLRARGRWASQQDIQYIFNRCEIGDWFLLYQLSKNVDGLAFKEICRDLMSKMYSGL